MAPPRWQETRRRVAIAGVVTEDATARPLAGATVELTAGPAAFEKLRRLARDRAVTTTDANGLFHFLDLPPGAYTVGASLAIVGALLAAAAVSVSSLWLLAAATFVTGVFNAFGASYRFAAADVADAYRPGFRARAISLVLTGGIAGGTSF